MKITPLHPWDVSPAEAVTIQQRLRGTVSLETGFAQVRTVAGVDVSIKDDIAKAAVVVLDYPDLTPIDQSTAEQPVQFPYIPGLLAFREGPVVLKALEELVTEPDLFIFDAQGLAHPRRMGLATHIGIIIDRPSIGCAKSRLCGTHHEPGPERGAYTYLRDGNEIIGAVVRSRSKVQPVYVSVGHKIDLEAAISHVLNCCRGYRLPETTRWAHRVAGGEEIKREGTQLSLF
ncbi:MAG TPA: deoxyribonuclease V [Anaerolineae bacterium]|nr:deoxyribonuclease V [Anaerolineae bacterium]